VKYHLLHPDYINKRIADLPGKFGLRVLLVLVDEVRSQCAKCSPYVYSDRFPTGASWGYYSPIEQACHRKEDDTHSDMEVRDLASR
jgi:hypothetical protein